MRNSLCFRAAGNPAICLFATAMSFFVAVQGPAQDFVWTGVAGDGKFSSAGNWRDGAAPGQDSGADATLDFSQVASETAVKVDVANLPVFAGATMGTGVVVFSGRPISFKAVSDTSKIAVGFNSKVTLDGNLEITGSSDAYVVDRVETDGMFVVTGDIVASSGFSGANLYQGRTCGGGAVVARGLVHSSLSSDSWSFRIANDANGCVNWVIGENGLSGTKKFYINRNSSRTASIQAYTNDFAISKPLAIRSTLTLNTTGLDGLPHTVTVGDGTESGGGISRDGVLKIAGTGKVVANYSADAVDSNGSTGTPLAISVLDTATLALKEGSYIGKGTLTVGGGATLAFPDAATISLGVSSLTLLSGAVLEFDIGPGFDDAADPRRPVLNTNGKTVAANGSVAVRIVAEAGYRPACGTYVLTERGGFANADVSSADGNPNWASQFSVDGSGNIVLTVSDTGTIFMIK